MQHKNLFTPLHIGEITLPNRILMAPLTRSRSPESTGNVPPELVAEYYKQRAGAGLIISEGVIVSRQAMGFIDTPGLYTDAQTAAWKNVTDKVHAKGGKIFAQLWHTGRTSHPDFHDGELPVAPSALDFDGYSFTRAGFVPCVKPRALETNEVSEVVKQFRQAGLRAKEAGFDGVELHGANGYLVEQFLYDGSNRRTDAYGGSIENRARFMFEILESLIEVWGDNRVGVRISPHSRTNGVDESNRGRLFNYLAKELNRFNLAYLHVLEVIPGLTFSRASDAAEFTARLRERYDGILILNGGLGRDTGNEAVASGRGDAIAFGSLFIANPDLPERFRRNAQLNETDPDTFYVPGSKGYTDYPFIPG